MSNFLGSEQVEEDIVKLIFGYLGNALALFFFFSPIILIYNLIIGKAKRQDIPFVLFAANVLNCLFWFVYGWFKPEFLMYLCNGIGCVTSIIYLLIYVFYFSEKLILRILTVVGTALLIIGIFSLFFWGVGKEGNETTGDLAMAFNIIMYAAPGQKLVLYILSSLKFSKQRIIN